MPSGIRYRGRALAPRDPTGRQGRPYDQEGTVDPSPMRRRLGNLLAGLPIIMIMAALAGCGTDKSDVAVDVTPVPYPNVTFPLEPYRITDEEMRTINTARAVVMQRCLKRFGIDVSMPAQIVGLPYTLIDDRYGLTDAEHAQEWGYRGKEPPRIYEFEGYVPREYAGLMYGRDQETVNGEIKSSVLTTYKGQDVPKGGCYGESLQALSGSAPILQGDDLPKTLDRESWKRSGQDPRVQELIGAWSTCLKNAGYRYKDPHDAVKYWNRYGAHGRPDKDEVRAALEDVRCNREVGLVGVWADIDIEIQRELVETNAEKLKIYRQELDTYIKNATKIVSGG